MNDNTDQSPDPEDLSPGEKSTAQEGNWNFKNPDAAASRFPSGKQHAEVADDIFDSLEEADPVDSSADKERMSELQREVREKRRMALAEAATAAQRDLESVDSEDEAGNEDDQADEAEDGPQKKALGFKLMELIFVGIFVAVFGAGLVWILKEAVSFPRDSHGIKPAKMPATGEYAVVTSLRDFWREPIITGQNPDKPSLGMKLIPVVEITLGEESQTGVLRFFFRDPDGELVGDPRAVEFENGRFKINDSPTIQVSSTIGFSDAADFNRYKYEDLEFWTVDVLEGVEGLDAGEFKRLFSHDISADLEGEISLDLYE